MSVRVLSLWEALEIYDEMGSDRRIGLFEREHDARRAVVGRGGYAGDGRVKVVELRIYPDFISWETDETERARASALAKLTKAERKALGVD